MPILKVPYISTLGMIVLTITITWSYISTVPFLAGMTLAIGVMSILLCRRFRQLLQAKALGIEMTAIWSAIRMWLTLTWGLCLAGVTMWRFGSSPFCVVMFIAALYCMSIAEAYARVAWHRQFEQDRPI